MTTEGKLEQLIKQKRTFLKASVKDYSNGGNDMLDDVQAMLEEAKTEITKPTTINTMYFLHIPPPSYLYIISISYKQKRCNSIA